MSLKIKNRGATRYVPPSDPTATYRRPRKPGKPANDNYAPPANDNYRRPSPRNPWPLPKEAPIPIPGFNPGDLLRRRLPFPGGGFGAGVDLLEQYVYPKRELKSYHLGPFKLYKDCLAGGPTTPHFYRGATTSTPTTNCLSGQSTTEHPMWRMKALPTTKSFCLARWYELNGFGYARNLLWYNRTGTNLESVLLGVRAGANVLPSSRPRINPNILRRSPTIRPHPLAEPEPAVVPQVAPNGRPAPRAFDAPAYRRAFEWSANGKRPRPVGRRAPPPKRVRERKTIGKRIAFEVADQVSELSEIVDAFYASLPESTRKRAEKNWRDEVFPLDKAGQYGVGRVDEKFKVLWNNWHRIDPDKSMRNLMNNAAQDFVNGLIHKNVPKNTGGALDPAIKEINKWLDDYVYV